MLLSFDFCTRIKERAEYGRPVSKHKISQYNCLEPRRRTFLFVIY